VRSEVLPTTAGHIHVFVFLNDECLKILYHRVDRDGSGKYTENGTSEFGCGRDYGCRKFLKGEIL